MGALWSKVAILNLSAGMRGHILDSCSYNIITYERDYCFFFIYLFDEYDLVGVINYVWVLLTSCFGLDVDMWDMRFVS